GLVTHRMLGLVRPRRRTATSEVFEQEEEIIGTRDDRTRIRKTTVIPYRWICFLEMDFPTMTGWGSGVLISPRHVLTCGHNLVDHDTGTVALSIKVYPGCDRVSNRPFGFQTSTTWRTSDEWRAGPDARFDYGLITLPNPIGN